MLRCRGCDVKESVDVMHSITFLYLGLKLAASSAHLTIYGAHYSKEVGHNMGFAWMTSLSLSHYYNLLHKRK